MNGPKKTRKSHHGCSECKRRSVKCDEQKPQCSHCENRQATCHYAASSPILWADASSNSSHSNPTRPSTTIPQEQTPPNQHPNQIAPQFNTQHLRLLLNWTTSTSHTISRNPADAPVWQKVIPERALSCPYLMHGIFAVSALHLALSSDSHGEEKRLLIEDAEYHQSEAIKMFTEVGNILGHSERIASFALSSILIGSAFAFPLTVPMTCETRASPLDELIEVFMLIRKMMEFSAPAIEDVRKSELSGLLHVEEYSDSSESSRLRIEALRQRLDATFSRHHDRESHEVFSATIDCLERLVSKLDGKADMISGIFVWVCEVPAGFVALLRVYDPLALAIVAYYCVVLHYLRERWFISSWGERVLDVIVKALDPQWRDAVEWVVHEVKGCG